MQWKIKKWLSFEKSGRVSDYLTYCRKAVLENMQTMRPTAREEVE